ncbi:MAG: hypothetical protein RLN75_05595 [Longimicrobiales bacterium]
MTTTWRNSAILAIATLALTTGAAAGQYAAPTNDRAGGDAAEYLRQAQAAVDEDQDWGKASVLFAKAAELQTDDPAAARSWRLSGLLAYYAGREGRAIDALERSAEAALAWGDVATAARSFLDAAWVARHDGDDRRTLELAQRGERLASSPLLARAERAELMSRIADDLPPQLPGS